MCDQGSCNQRLFKDLDVTVEKPVIQHKGREYIAMFDTPHLLKSMRNTLQSHDLIIDGCVISWKYIMTLYDLDSTAKIGLRLAPKLTKKHIDLPAFSKIKVSRAAQIFSYTTAAALTTYMCSGKLPHEAIHTANFLRQMDQLFDCFNVNTVRNSKLFRRAIRADSPHWEFLAECKSMLAKMEVLNSRGRVVNISGWQQNINALTLLRRGLQSDPPSDFGSVHYLLTRRVNQDSLENLFSVVRQRGGFRDNPGGKHFRDTFKQCMVNSFLKPPSAANCQLDVDRFVISLANVPKKNKPVNTVSADHVSKAKSVDLSDIAPTCHTLPQENALVYVAGYMCRKVLAKHDCEDCKAILVESEAEMNASHEDRLFCFFKRYDHIPVDGDFGPLIIPSERMLEFLSGCEDVFVGSFMNVIHVSGLSERLCRVMQTKFGTVLCLQEKCQYIFQS